MSIQASGENIRAITGTVKSDDELNAFIIAANAKMVRVASCNPDLSSTELNAVADWYASYLLAAGASDSTLGIKREKLEQYEVEFQGSSSESAADRYWKVANDLSGGCLATLDKQTAQIAVL